MATSSASLLPPNAQLLERAIDAAAERVSDVPLPFSVLWDPAECPAELLPWLAWGFSVDRWDAAWPEARKRAAVAASIEIHRQKGTAAAVDAVLASFDQLLSLVEWHETTPRGAPHTFDVVLELVTAPNVAPGGDRARAAFAEAVIREVSAVKRKSQHMRLVQQLRAEASIGIIAAAQTMIFRRADMAAAGDASASWLSLLQTEHGEPLQAEDSSFLETKQ